jgi:multisubunit Na+/H+ antiporter MnhB subunit
VLAAFVHDLRSAARGMLRAPGFALTAVLMLAAGLGACLYVYGVIQRVGGRQRRRGAAA